MRLFVLVCSRFPRSRHHSNSRKVKKPVAFVYQFGSPKNEGQWGPSPYHIGHVPLCWFSYVIISRRSPARFFLFLLLFVFSFISMLFVFFFFSRITARLGCAVWDVVFLLILFLPATGRTATGRTSLIRIR